jgi:hypothetical protein
MAKVSADAPAAADRAAAASGNPAADCRVAVIREVSACKPSRAFAAFWPPPVSSGGLPVGLLRAVLSVLSNTPFGVCNQIQFLEDPLKKTKLDTPKDDGAGQLIRVTCEAAGVVDLDLIIPFQGELKSLSEENYHKLKKLILEMGITFPFFVWKHGGKLLTLDGHQRDRVLLRMRDQENYRIPKVPVAYIEAANKKEARKKVLALSSQFGKITGKSLYDYLEDSDLGYDEIKDVMDLPQIDLGNFEREFINNENIPDNQAMLEKQKELQKKWGTALGDLWQIPSKSGTPHLFACGDSREVKAPAVDLICTDPPFEIAPAEVIKAVERFSKVMVILTAGGQAFKLANLWDWQRDFVWVHKRPRMMWTKAMPISYHNLILVLTTGGAKCRWKKLGSGHSSLIQLDHEYEDSAMGHGKNALIFVKMMEGFQWAKTIADPFGGTGSTMLGCEATGRTCYSVELEPGHLAVALERWATTYPDLRPRKIEPAKARSQARTPAKEKAA